MDTRCYLIKDELFKIYSKISDNSDTLLVTIYNNGDKEISKVKDVKEYNLSNSMVEIDSCEFDKAFNAVYNSIHLSFLSKTNY